MNRVWVGSHPPPSVWEDEPECMRPRSWDMT
jgi:hypothetical protein